MGFYLMKKKTFTQRFSSYLYMGKAAALPVFLTPSVGLAVDVDLGVMTGTTLHIIEKPATDLRLASDLYVGAPDASAYGGGTAANVVFPSVGCSDAEPQVMNIVVTGIQHGDTVFLMSSRDKDVDWGSSFVGLRIGADDMRLLAKFDFSLPVEYSLGNFPAQASGVVSIPVNISDLSLGVGETIYLQAATGVQTLNPATPWTNLRFSELDKIVTIEDCSNSAYGSGGLIY